MITKIIVVSNSRLKYGIETYLKDKKFFTISITNPEDDDEFGSSKTTLNLKFHDADRSLSNELIDFHKLKLFDGNHADQLISFINQIDENKTEDYLLLHSKEGNSRAATIATWLRDYLGFKKVDDIVFCFEQGKRLNENKEISEVLRKAI